jgi:UDP-N-acetylmuramyl pentapeptide phosphotransferase/UDP-N-acetylglucosamine-1-phosphate transferase
MDLLVQMGGGLALAAFALTVLATRRVLAYLRQRQILDLPNERSSHSLPTPRGGGLATTPVMVLALLALPDFRWLAVGAVGLLIISWVDDRKGLPPLPRFAAQVAAVAAFLLLLPAESLVFQGVLPAWADHLLAGLCWLWFVNLYNFMDGIDGITGIETISLGLGIALVGGVAVAAPGLTVAAVAAGFLLFNWHPAKLFLGDSGSVPFGYVLGGLLILLAVRGQLAAALILPAYYLADATITITRRALAGEKIWQPHRRHFYQRAVQGGKRHDQVALAIAIGNAALVGCAVLATGNQVALGGGLAVVTVGVLLMLLHVWSRGAPA